MRSRHLVSSVVSAGLVASALVLGGAPAQAAEGIGSGRALIHIDAPTATVVKTGKNSYRMILPPDSSGQWMGERTNAAGVTQTRVGDLTAKKLSTKWGKFRYTSQGVLSTLAWVTADGPSTALVRLSQPKVTDAGVRFDFTSKFTIPSKLQDVSINLQRAPKKAGVRKTADFQISDQLYIYADQPYSNQISTKIYNKSNNNTCWGTKTVMDSDTGTYSVATNTCDNIRYENHVPAGTGYPAYGLSVAFPGGGNGSQGSVTYYLDITLPNTTSAYKFVHAILTWP